MPEYSDAELAAFFDEALPPELASAIESRLRLDDSLRERLIEIRSRDMAGLHSIGSIWRRSRLSCPSRGELGEYLLGVLEPEVSDWVAFHLDSIGCRFCVASLEDLQSDAPVDGAPQARRRRYFQTSAGYLKRD